MHPWQQDSRLLQDWHPRLQRLQLPSGGQVRRDRGREEEEARVVYLGNKFHSSVILCVDSFAGKKEHRVDFSKSISNLSSISITSFLVQAKIESWPQLHLCN